MVDDKRDGSDAGFTRIAPVSINLTSAAASERKADPQTASRYSPLLWLGLGVLLSAALVVIFLLPRWVDKPAPEPIAAAAPAASTSPAPTPARPVNREAMSPWEKAQESSLRKETQDILSKMLEAQRLLAEKAVDRWAAEKHAEAMKFATAGDDRYNQRDFVNARMEYEKALGIFSSLVEQVDVVFKASMDRGEQALLDGDASAATAAFELALAIDSIDRAAILGKERALTLDEVMALLEKGDELLQNGRLGEAKETYQQALALDSHMEIARQKTGDVEREILQQSFNNHMSAGFAAMDKGRLGEARSSFNAALKLKPGSVEARSALEQSNHKLTTVNISELLVQARTLEQQEQWQAAQAKYKAALELDGSLAEAQEGEHRSTLRAKIHEKLEQILAKPERLYDADVYAESVDFQTRLLALSERGPLLNRQLDSLAKYLEVAVAPIDVTFKSDNQTRVTLRKVGELGLFVEKHMTLRPGKYVAVGVREGYRDVRVEFSIDPDKTQQTIIIQAAEKIALGR